MSELSPKHLAFVNEYLDCFDATEAYTRVYSPKKRDTARAAAARLLANVSVQKEIGRRLQERAMTVDEAVGRLADFARGDLADFMDVSGMGFHINLRDALEAGKTHLIKKIRQKTTIYLGKKESDEDREVHEIEIELHDPQSAIDKILKVAGAYITKHEVTTKDWRTEVIELLKAGQLKPADVEKELGTDLAAELFIAAGVPIATG